MRRRLLGLTLLAACQETPAQVCFEVQAKQTDMVCGYTGQELLELGERTDPWFGKACFALDDCPDPCEVEAIVHDEVVPAFLEGAPNFEFYSEAPMCREDDEAADECCYWVKFEGINHSAP